MSATVIEHALEFLSAKSFFAIKKLKIFFIKPATRVQVQGDTLCRRTRRRIYSKRHGNFKDFYDYVLFSEFQKTHQISNSEIRKDFQTIHAIAASGRKKRDKKN